jgi:hypothetical protein
MTPPAERLGIADAHEHDRVVHPGAGRDHASPEIWGDVTIIAMHQEALPLVLLARDARRPV